MRQGTASSIQFHGSSKPSGLVRTYPNEFTREGTLNYEVCKWDTLVNADHDIAIPFTRMLAGGDGLSPGRVQGTAALGVQDTVCKSSCNEHTLPYVGHVCGFGKPSHLVVRYAKGL